jgi:hypothetical protein
VSSTDGDRISGAIVTFLDSVNAGRTASTNSNGDYRFEGLQIAGATLSATASGFSEERRPTTIGTGTNTLNFTLQREGPAGSFGPGTWLVGTQIEAGRYFAQPRPGCYWERVLPSGAVTANEMISDDAEQIIVEILSGDRSFRATDQCGTWSNTPRRGLETSIPPGVWLVNTQIVPGEYQTQGTGCYWERLSGFRGDTGDVIASGSPSGAGPHTVTISSGDAGFRSSGDCETWAKTN